MRKNYIWVLLPMILSIFIITGCKSNKNENLNMTLTPKELTGMEQAILNSTFSKHYFIGKINNLPKEQKYNMEINTEYYKDNKLEKRENVGGISIENTESYITINIGHSLDEKNKMVPFTMGAYDSIGKDFYSGGSGSSYMPFVDFSEVAYSSLNDEIKLDLGKEAILMAFASNDQNTTSINLSSDNNIKDGIKRNKQVILIKARIVKYNENN